MTDVQVAPPVVETLPAPPPEVHLLCPVLYWAGTVALFCGSPPNKGGGEIVEGDDEVSCSMCFELNEHRHTHTWCPVMRKGCACPS